MYYLQYLWWQYLPISYEVFFALYSFLCHEYEKPNIYVHGYSLPALQEICVKYTRCQNTTVHGIDWNHKQVWVIAPMHEIQHRNTLPVILGTYIAYKIISFVLVHSYGDIWSININNYCIGHFTNCSCIYEALTLNSPWFA